MLTVLGLETAAPMLIVTSTPTGRRSRTALRRRSAIVDRVLFAGAGQDDEDLLAADPVDRVAGTEHGAHRVGDVLEDRVAGRVAELVVDALEVVEIAEQQGMRLPLCLAARLAVELGEALLQRVAVEEAGQRVEGRAAPVGAVGLDQGAGEDHGAEDQGDGGDQTSGCARRRCRDRRRPC